MTREAPGGLIGKTAVVTGATSGIGEAAAFALARRGARVLIVARDKDRARLVIDGLTAASGQACQAVIADLSLMAEARRAATEVSAVAPRIDILLNNAGALFSRREVTSEGLERTFALNHMAYFIITQALLPNLIASRRGRIVSTASESHRHARFDVDDLQNQSRTGFAQAYARSKLHNVLWTHELARRLGGTSVTANCYHPGVVATAIGMDLERAFLRGLFKLQALLAKRPASGADCALGLRQGGRGM